ncbi:MAG: asparagine synthase (glutamine-hydrolyzing), partial [Deltaproteobacteria bacterium]|nr:asparagine synthase (glutamine-hydrolyzing) [Deltaproteobacteria bacterium]
DTEVIVHAYESWGEHAFERFNGQWALAMWSERTRSLVIARDPLGVRPLYFCEHAGRLYFASEIKAIFAADPCIPREFDPIGFDQVFTFWTTVPPQTVFRGVVELEPGHVRTYAGARVEERRFWSPKYPTGQCAQFQGSLADAAEATRAALEQATSLRMLRTDVPVGSYLSGGLDSSFVAALALRAKGEKFCTFSIRFEDTEYDETRYQRLMAQRLGSEHREIMVSRADIARVFPDVVWHAERPILRTAPAPLLLLSALVHNAGIKVVLTGEGADEMFAGYDLFREAKVRRFWACQPTSERRPRLLERLYPYLARSPVAQRAMTRQFFGQDLSDWQSPGFGHGIRWRTTAQLRRLFSAEQRAATAERDVVRELLASLPAEFARWSPLAQDQFLEVQTLLAGYILSSQGDRMLMAHSVEGRFPFLDRDVVDLANSLPASYKLRALDEKHIIKKAAWDLVPPEIVGRKKQPYRAPDALSFLGQEALDWVADVVSEQALEEAHVFSPTLAGQLLGKCMARDDAGQFSNADNMAVVGILSTQLLHDRFVRHRPTARMSGTPATIVHMTETVLREDRGDKRSS